MQTPSFTPTDLNDGFVVAITIEAKPGDEDSVATILDVMVEPTMAEPGVKLFLPYRSPTNPALFFVFELYVDAAGWAAHETTAHFKEAVAGLLPRVTRRERVPFVPFTPLSTSARSSAPRAG
jgi:quinol monooxygenase YgiN